jgi:PTS system cellobiose-specific IIB component
MKFNEDMIRDICALHQKPYAVLDNFVYSTLDGERGFDTVLSLLNEKEKV